MGPTTKVRLAVIVVVLAVTAAGCTDSKQSGSGSSTTASAAGGVTAGPFDGTYRATIQRTTDGVPHITGANVESVTYGQGYASGEDYSCTLRDAMVKIQGRRAEVLGAGDGDANVKSDFAWRTIGIDALARKDYPSEPDRIKAEMVAFAAGWNSHLQKVGADKVKGWCAGAAWLLPITPEDLYAYARSIALTASSTQLARYLGSAQPPASEAATAPKATPAAYVPGSSVARATAVAAPVSTPPPAVDLEAFAAALAPLRTGEQTGSNGWAIGKERTADGGGMLLANPHFPWEGDLRFWEVQLTVPGHMSIYGSQLQGLPGVGIGFTDGFGWTHTVSAGHRFTAYTLNLVPGKPTSYTYDDTEHAMTSRVETIKVKQPDGSLADQQRTLWFSEYGPILDFPGVGWSPTMTTTFRDANLDDRALLGQYLDMDQAKTFDEFKKAHEVNQGVPLFNTIAVSKDGRAWYADTSATPNLSPAAIAAYKAALAAGGIAKIAADSGAVVLDGSTSLNQWVDAPGARSPGLVPYAKMPQAERPDYVFNANDSFWFNHVGTALEGDYTPMHGDQRTAVSPRTRENATVLSDTTPSGPSGADGKFDLDELRGAALLDEGYTAAALRGAVVERCSRVTEPVAVPALAGSDGSEALPAAAVDIGAACRALQGWDGSYDLGSRGAATWREFLGRFDAADFTKAGALWAKPFDAEDPMGTPSGLAAAPASGPDPILVNLARAAQILTKAGVAPDASLGDVQFANRSGTRIPLHGGSGSEGLTNVVGWGGATASSEPMPKRGPTMAPGSGLTKDGYPISNGSSFILALDFTPTGPQAYAFLTYGETEDRTSPLFDVQTKRFSAKDWRKVVRTDAEIAADPALTTENVGS